MHARVDTLLAFPWFSLLFLACRATGPWGPYHLGVGGAREQAPPRKSSSGMGQGAVSTLLCHWPRAVERLSSTRCPTWLPCYHPMRSRCSDDHRCIADSINESRNRQGILGVGVFSKTTEMENAEACLHFFRGCGSLGTFSETRLPRLA